MSTRDDGGPAFPFDLPSDRDEPGERMWAKGMTLRDYYMAQALGNAAICTGDASPWELAVLFGKNNQGGITKQQIVAKQAASYADAMLREKGKA